jgi:hypothetical protein
MGGGWLTLLAALAASVVSAAPSSADGLTVVPPPPGAEAQWVARDMSYNGLPMTIRTFRVNTRIERVLEHYERRWQREYRDAEVLRRQRDGWNEIFVHTGGQFLSVRMRRKLGTVQGYITASADPRTVEPERSTELALPEGVRMLTRQTYRDGGRRAQNLMLASDRGMRTTAERFDRTLADAGWSITASRASQADGGGYHREYQRGGHHLVIQVGPGGRAGIETMVMANWMKP